MYRITSQEARTDKDPKKYVEYSGAWGPQMIQWKMTSFRLIAVDLMKKAHGFFLNAVGYYRVIHQKRLAPCRL